MKKLQLIAMLIIASFASQATVRTVNIAGGAQFTTIEAAVVASSSVAGDTIYISGSASPYPSPTTKKSNLTFIGSGFNVTKQNPLKTTITNTFTCTDSCKLIGLDISNGQISTNTTVSGLRVSRCRLGSNFSASTINNCMIDNCLYVFTANNLFSGSTLNNVAVNNCILYTNSGSSIFTTLSFAGGGLTFDHCNFINSTTSAQLMTVSISTSGVSYTNSVFYNFNPIPVNTTFTYLNNYASVALNGFSNSSGNIVGSNRSIIIEICKSCISRYRIKIIKYAIGV